MPDHGQPFATLTGTISRAPYGDALFVRVVFPKFGTMLFSVTQDGERVDMWEELRLRRGRCERR